MNWKIEEAQQQFSELMNAAVTEPQLIYNHDKLVAVVVEAELFQDFLAWQQQQCKPSLADAFLGELLLASLLEQVKKTPTSTKLLKKF